MISMRALTPVPHTQVRLADSFWAPRIQRNRDVTIPHVRKMLAETRLPVKQVGESLGFSSPAYFTRAFQSYTGKSPTAFRRAP